MDDNSTKPKMQRNSDVVNFQQESLNYNQLLPYYEEIEANSQQLFQKIKHNLALAVENGELRPGAMHWSIQLDNYIHAYGRRFSKDDHIKLVQLLYKLLTIPDLPPLLVQQFGCVLISLLSKKKLLSRDDLQLEWKPLYRLYHEVYYTNYENNTIRLKKIKSCCKPVIFRLMLATRTYFTASATEEMLQEWRPMMYPFDTSIMLKATSYFCSFLPTALLPHEHNQGFKLWFDELMNLYISCLNSPSWEANLVYLFVRLAKENIGYVHWEPYLAKIFQRILNSFNLPVGKRQVPRSKNAMYKANLCAEWIINMMGDKECKVQFYLNQLLRAIENFCHPSNVGAWVGKIQNFLGSLTSAFIYRLRLERKPKKTWVPKIPKEYHITDDDITTFVENIRPIAMLLLFTKHLSDEVALIIQNLSILRPEIMLPPLLDRTFASLTTLTEPHQVIATMVCAAFVSRPLASAGRTIDDKEIRFPSGPSYLMKLLELALPGIDLNDSLKTSTTLIFYMAAFGLIPIVDCSMLASEEALTEEEKELCSLTARFEDILIQFIDRCFEMIENSSNVESLKSYNTIDGESSFNNEDRQFAEGFYRVFMTILSQSSRTLAMVVIKKLFGFVRGHILGDTIAGHICCAIVSAAANAQPEMTLKLFLPYYSRNILEIIETDDFVDEEQVESGLIWYLLVFSKLMTADGRYIIQYKDHIYKVISMSIHLKSKTASNFTCQGFSSLLESLTAVYPGDRSMANDSPSQYNYLKDWAKCYDRRDVVIDWHKPSEAEMEFAHDLMHDFLIQETNKMQDLTTGPINMKREEIHQCLHIIYCILTGAGEALPPWDKPYLSPLVPSVVPYSEEIILCTENTSKFSKNTVCLREIVANCIHTAIGYFLDHVTDDTKSFNLMLSIYDQVLFNYGGQNDHLQEREFLANWWKRLISNKLLGHCNCIRQIVIEKSYLQHLKRRNHIYPCRMTELHQMMISDILKLSVCDYCEIRREAQGLLLLCYESILFSCTYSLPFITDKLKADNSVSHDEFKGALFVLTDADTCKFVCHQWENMQQIWPALVKADHSEKSSILILINKVYQQMCREYATLALKYEVPVECREAARALTGTVSVSNKDGDLFLEEMNNCNRRQYMELVNLLLDLCETGDNNMRWQFLQYCIGFIAQLIRIDIPLLPRAIALFTKNLIHDSIEIRKMAVSAIASICKQLKRKHLKIEISVKNAACAEASSEESDINNDWLVFPLENNRFDVKDWKSNTLIDKPYIGYNNVWPRSILTHAASEQQPKVDRGIQEMTEHEAAMYAVLNSHEFIESLIKLYSLEISKDEAFNMHNYAMFKGIFRNFGDSLLPLFERHVENLFADTEHSSSQKCALEIVAGLVRGSKHWGSEKEQHLWLFLTPLLRKAFNSISRETINDWCTFVTTISKNRDPKRLRSLFSLLFNENIFAGEQASFLDASALSLIRIFVSDMEWKGYEVQNLALKLVSPWLDHQYKDVRSSLGSLLRDIFKFDVAISKNYVSKGPTATKFIESLLPSLSKLFTEDKRSDGNVELVDPEEKQATLRLSETLLEWLISCNRQNSRTPQPYSIATYKLLPLLIGLENQEDDKDLQILCKLAFGYLAQAQLSDAAVDSVMLALTQVVQSNSWHHRYSMLLFIQVMTFRNLFLLFEHTTATSTIEDILLKLIFDEQIEVREMASTTYSGLLRCGFLEVTSVKLSKFRDVVTETKIKRRHNIPSTEFKKVISRRHSAILGLAACIQAFPYDVPPWLPEILIFIGDRLNDPPPIKTTVKSVVSEFKRTHLDNWEEHKQYFTVDQLSALSDFLISPSYYA
ncbi:Proteasome activator complex subunit 4 [Trichoplax sp. H2]|nr:Proteasome activator complex subunit 4 [Trichoplax sp. H2]|eukprot:RDD38509.1 Proteasome activator complex subunit 4 [Trichoplax sp. H2]